MADQTEDMEQQLITLVAQVQVLESVVDALWAIALAGNIDSTRAVMVLEESLNQEYPDPGDTDLSQKRNRHYKLAHVIVGIRLREIKKRLSSA